MTQLSTATAAPAKNELLTNLKPMAVDIAVPLATYIC